jgi:hypothetical protein
VAAVAAAAVVVTAVAAAATKHRSEFTDRQKRALVALFFVSSICDAARFSRASGKGFVKPAVGQHS